jgi:hypothetical protein
MPPKKHKSSGKKRRHRGGSALEKAQKAADVVRDIGRVLKDTQLISKTASMFNPAVGGVIETVGLGRRRRRHAGGSLAGDVFSTLGKIAQAPVLGVLGGIGGLTQGLSGLGAQQGGSAYGSRPVLV